MNKLTILALAILAIFPTQGSLAITDSAKDLKVTGTLDISAISNKAAVKSTLSLVIGSDLQAWSTNLDSLSGQASTSYGRGTLNLANAAAFRTYGGLVIGTNVQAWSANLDSLSVASTSYGRGVLNLADASALRTYGGLVIGTNVLAPNGVGSALTALTAGNISAGGTFPAINGAALTALTATNISSGTMNSDRLGGNLDAIQDLTATSFVNNGGLLRITTNNSNPLMITTTGTTFQDNVLGIANYSSTTPVSKTFTIANPAGITNDELTCTAHGYVEGQYLILSTTGTLPAGLLANQPYYVQLVDANKFKISTRKAISAPAATVSDITGVGTGTHTCTTKSEGYSAINWYSSTSVTPGLGTIYINNASLAAGDWVFETNANQLGGNPNIIAAPSIRFRLLKDDGGGTLYAHDMLTLDSLKNATVIYSYQVNAPIGSAAITVPPADAPVCIYGLTPLTTGYSLNVGGIGSPTNSGVAFIDRTNTANFWGAKATGSELQFFSVVGGVQDNGIIFSAVFGTNIIKANVHNAWDIGEAGTRFKTVYGMTGNFTTAITTAGTLNVTGASTLGTTTMGSGGTSVARVKHGTAVLVSGTVTVSDSTIGVNTRIICNRNIDGGTVGTTTGYSITRSNGVNFTITAKLSAGTTATADTSTMAYIIIEP